MKQSFTKNFTQTLLTGVLVSMLFACGGGGDGAPAAGDNNTGHGATTPDVVQREGIAILANNRFVDYQHTASGKPVNDSEAATLEYVLRLQGNTVTPFTDISVESLTAELKNKKTLIIPELQRGGNGNLNGPLEQAQHTLIADFVRTGGTLIGFLSATIPSDRIGYVLTSTFGYNLINVATNISVPINRTDNTGTGYENCGLPSLAVDKTPQTNGYRAIDSSSLPDQAQIIYADANGNAMVTVIPEGEGQVILLGWNYRRIKPMAASGEGYLDGGWWNVLYRAARYDEVLPKVAVIGFDDATRVARASNALMETCQIGEVTTITHDSGGLPQSVAALMPYDAVLFFRERNYDVADMAVLSNFTDSLSDYTGNGGALVMANARTFEEPFRADLGRLEQLMLINAPSGLPIKFVFPKLAAIDKEYHPISAGLISDFGDSDLQFSYSNSRFAFSTDETAASGSSALLKYTNGYDLVRIGEISGTRRVDINTTPVPSIGTQIGTGTSGEIGRLVANSMIWASEYNQASFQTFTYDQTIVMVPPGESTTAPIQVTGAPGFISEIKIRITVNHPSISDLDMSLIAPATDACSGLGSIRLAFSGTDGGDNYSNKEISDSGSVTIINTLGTLANINSLIPVGNLSRCQNADANGEWALSVFNTNKSSSNLNGEIVSWSLLVR